MRVYANAVLNKCRSTASLLDSNEEYWRVKKELPGTTSGIFWGLKQEEAVSIPDLGGFTATLQNKCCAMQPKL
jgi:hypothetical protein